MEKKLGKEKGKCKKQIIIAAMQLLSCLLLTLFVRYSPQSIQASPAQPVQEPVHDVSVTSVTPLFSSVFRGYPNPITVVVSNDGDFTETFSVDVKYGGTHVTTSPITVTNLPPKTSKQLIFCWVTRNVPPGIYTITAYANPVPGETDTADNTFIGGVIRVTIPGDIMEPFAIVDMTDIGWICYSFGCGPGSPRWNPNADINNDGFVDMTDIGYACLNYGKQDP